MNERDVERLQSELEELFGDVWHIPRFAGPRRVFRPQVDCFRTEEPAELTVVVELPGVDPGRVRIDATPRVLVVSGERSAPRDPARTYHRMEIDYGPFERRIELAEEVDTAAATASYRDGLLTIVLPVAQRPPRPLRVPIEVRAKP